MVKQGYVYLHNNVFPTLLALSNEEQQQGLMYLDPPSPVMSFVYASPQINRFWMANVKFPLDIVFCNNGKVSEICYGEPYSTRIIGDYLFSDLVVELPGGMAKDTNIKIGQTAGLISPEPKQLFGK
jgi:uncharacterized protein